MKTAVITGASSGIGLELAQLFAQDGIAPTLVARSETKLQQLADKLKDEYGVEAQVIPMDLSKQEAPEQLFKACEERQLEVDYLINNAGFGDFGEIHQTDYQKMGNMIMLNIFALTALSRLFSQAMVERGQGHILNVASTAAFQPGPTMAVYFATKAYVLSFSEGIRHELKKYGIYVTCLAPGATETGFQESADLEGSGLFKDKKLPSAQEVAAFGYKAMKKGKGTVVHGTLNRFLAFTTRFTPRSVTAKISEQLMKKD